MKVTFITGNENKAKTLEKYLGYPVGHRKVDLDELQSLELREIVEHKVKQAFELIKEPVLVEDISFEIGAVGHLPGPFIKWFIEELGFEKICRLADSDASRAAVTKVCYGYYDGSRLELFEGELHGSMPKSPRGSDGFGWNCVFIPDGQSKTNAEMTPEETEKYSLRTTTVYPALRKFLSGLDSK
jgi:non-canonical purine NTP pyrophosphatase (RdgB/HAM1 family)